MEENEKIVAPPSEENMIQPQQPRSHMNIEAASAVAETMGIVFSKPVDVENVVCEDVVASEITEEHIDLTRKMLRLLASINGLGLAAPQIGINKKFFVYWDTRQNVPHVCYNSKYYGSGKKSAWVEKCLTYGKLSFAIRRFKYIQAVWWEYDPDLKSLVKRTRALRDLEAEVFQHETDHLNGKTIATEGIFVQ